MGCFDGKAFRDVDSISQCSDPIRGPGCSNFDSWVGCLSPADYEDYVLPYSKRVIDGIEKSVPLIHFATSSATLLELMKQAGGDVIGVDWRVDIREAWKHLGDEVAIQGNLDPVVLFGRWIRSRRK